MIRHRLPAGVALCALTWGGCAYPTDAERYRRVDDASFQLAQAEPADGATGQPVNPVVRLRFTAPPDPATVTDKTLLLRKGTVPVPVKVEVDLLGKRVDLRLMGVKLEAGADYEVWLGPELRGLTGNGLAEERRVKFRTAQPAVEAPAEVDPAPVTLRELLAGKNQDGLTTYCTGFGCHSGNESTPAARGLDLKRAPEEIRRYLVSTVGRGSPEGLPLLSPGKPESSYFFRKVLAWDGFMRTEGYPMPYDPTDPASSRRLDGDTLTRISTWIRQGAQP
jgi:hypothetical protein